MTKVKGKPTVAINTDEPLDFTPSDSQGNPITVQNPTPSDGDSVYAKDIDTDNSNIGGFSGNVTDLFDSLKSVISNASGTNPKTIKVWFHRTVYASAIGLGCDNLTKDFGSSITIELLGSGEVVRKTIQSVSDDVRSRLISFEPAAFNGFNLIFNTTDEVCISNVTIRKENQTVSRIQGLNKDGDPRNVRTTNGGNLTVSIEEYGDTPSIDAFSRLRMSAPFTLFDSKQLHDKQPLFWDEAIGGSASSTHSASNASVAMTVTTNAADYVIRQTKQRFNYQPGKSQLIFLTFLCPCVDGVIGRVGAFDDDGTGNNLTPNNGIFLQSEGNGGNSIISWNIAKNGTVTESFNQDQWNVDKLDGTGNSGITLDLTKIQIAIIDYEWLGVGRVRVGFVIDGLIYYCHYFNHSNRDFTSVYMSTPNLPLRYDIQSDGSGTGTLSHICGSVISEGGQQETGVLRSVDTDDTHVDADTANTKYAVVGIKLKTAYKDVTVLPEFFSMINETGDDFRWSLCLNPTISGTFTYSDVPNSAVQQARGATANVVTDEGLIIDSGYTVSGSFGAGGGTDRKFETSLRMGASIDGDLDEIVLCVMPLSGGADIQASLTFRELL